jgi:hypothetical protein
VATVDIGDQLGQSRSPITGNAQEFFKHFLDSDNPLLANLACINRRLAVLSSRRI